jgi:flagellar biosynthesis anti-sigma factor FlgM
MRIKDAYNNPLISSVIVKPSGSSESRGSGGAASEVRGEEGRSSVSLSISSRALQLSSANGGIDTAKVDRLKPLVDSGEFKVDPQVVADRIVNESSQ